VLPHNPLGHNKLTNVDRGCWEQNLDMSSDEVVQQVIQDAGFDGGAVLARASSDKYKQALRNLTQEAKQIGLCGVPSYRVFRRASDHSWKQAGGLVWGQDELAVVEDMISGASDNDFASVPSANSETHTSRL